MQGIIFGIIDNTIMLLGAYFGLGIEKLYPKRLKYGTGAILGAGIGNAISDFFGGLGERNIQLAFGTLIGCLLALILIPILNKVKR
jgi:hypothetical protein